MILLVTFWWPIHLVSYFSWGLQWQITSEWSRPSLFGGGTVVFRHIPGLLGERLQARGGWWPGGQALKDQANVRLEVSASSFAKDFCGFLGWICALCCFVFARAKFWMQYSTLVSAAVIWACRPITALLFCDRPMRRCELLAEAGWRLMSARLLLCIVLFVLALGFKAQLFETLAVSCLINGSVFMHTTFRRERVAVSRCFLFMTIQSSERSPLP